MDFLELVNLRLDYLQAYSSEIYYKENRYKAKNWVKYLGDLYCKDITQQMIEKFILKRRKVSPITANKEIRYLKATFNYAIRKGFMTHNPAEGIKYFPVDKKLKYIPSIDDVNRVIEAADADTQDYLWTIRETLARVNEINQLEWSDVDFKQKFVVLYTRKKRGGHRTPRKIPMTDHLFHILKRRYKNRDQSKPWVFWHSYWSGKSKQIECGPYKDRKGIMRSLCKKAGVKYFRYHALRHNGASLLESANVSIGSIQRILGHENRSTTEIYINSIGESERKAMEIFEQASKKSHTNSHTATSMANR